MAARANKLGPGQLSLGEIASPTEFGTQITSGEVSPETETEDDTTVLSGDVIAGEESTKWTLKGAILQEYSATSLLLWCKENAGTVVPFTFQPRTDEGLTVTGSCKIRPVRVGGEVKSQNDAEFEFPIIGDPTFTGV